MSGQRATPFHCPYCGEDTVRPFGDDPDRGHGDWQCESCTRAFTLRYRGLVRPEGLREP